LVVWLARAADFAAGATALMWSGGEVVSKIVGCQGGWRLSASMDMEGLGMHKIWLGVVVLAVEAVVLVWLVAAHTLQWLCSGLAGQ
jgi:hypothetical protein